MKKLSYVYLLFLGLCCFSGFPVLAQWSSRNLSPSRYDMVTVDVGSKTLFAGGYHFPDVYTRILDSQVDIYDGVTNQWTTDQLSRGRTAITAITVDNLVFLAGGRSEQVSYYGVSPFDDINIYNASTGQWTTAKLSSPRFDIGVASAAGKVFFNGGRGNFYAGFMGIDVYDIATNTWSTI